MEDPLLWQIIFQIVLIMLNAVFACAEIAVLSVNENRLIHFSKQGNKNAVRLIKLTKQPARFLATIQVAITLSGFLGSAFAADNFSDRLVKWAVSKNIPISPQTLDTVSVILITLILSYVTLVFGELVPKRLAMKKSENIALSLSPIVWFISKLFAPIVWLLTASTNAVLHLLGINPNVEENNVSEDDIKMMVDMGTEKGVIDVDEKEMITNVFEFDDITVGEFATRRTDIAVLWTDESINEWEDVIQKTRHTLYPVCDGTIDNVIGVLNIKDYYVLKDKSIKNIMQNVIKQAHFIPESLNANLLFKQMKKNKNHLAVVMDEYGGIVGIVTMNDLLEQLVGNLNENTNNIENGSLFKQVNPDTWEVSGDISLDEIAEELSIDLPIEEYDTFGGFVFGTYGSIPKDGSSFELNTSMLKINVDKIKSHRIEKAVIKIITADNLS